MKPTNPLQLLKALPRYALIPVKRWNTRTPPLVVFIGPKHVWGKAISDRPHARVILRSPNIGDFEFHTSLAPWLLSDRRASVVVASQAPEYLSDFCARHRIQLTMLLSTSSEGKAIKAAATAPTKKAPSQDAVPAWFRRDNGTALKHALQSELPVFLYMPWIPEHGDAVADKLTDRDYLLAPFDMINGVADNATRREAFRFARTHPDLYRRMVIRRLTPIAGRVSGFIFTFDWAPITRIIVEVCRTLGIPTILIPHESAFIDQDLYYRDPISGASMPACDMILAWGQLQRRIFTARGYNDAHIEVVGAPKFDPYATPRSQISRTQFHQLFGLSPERPTILFATQPLDSQTDTEVARTSQRAAIRDLLRYVETEGAQLLVRTPPSRDDILGPDLRQVLTSSDHAAVDDAEFYLVSPEEAVKHVDVIASINSTMLFEGLLAGKPAVSMRYIEFDSIWDNVGVLVAKNLDQAADLISQAFSGALRPREGQLAWAAEQLGVGHFDGQATQRIKTFLRQRGPKLREMDRDTPLDRLRRGERVDVVALPANEALESTTQKYLQELLNANTLLRTPADLSLAHAPAFAGVDIFLQWGGGDTPEKSAQRAFARALGKPTAIIEDGLIRSIDIGLMRSPGLSLLVDDRAAYYDATRPSRLEMLLESGPNLSPSQYKAARSTINAITSARVSKYNHAPDYKLDVQRPAVLVIDQRMDDHSVSLGMATGDDFEKMVLSALEDWPDYDILIKQHPDTTLGQHRGYLTASRLSNAAITSSRIRVIDQDINPYSLFDLVDDVYAVTSGMGFEALMAGKRVHCFGMPFYAGWGLTNDRKTSPRRSRNRALEDVFHFSYVQATRYFDPEIGRRVSLEDFVGCIVRDRPSSTLAVKADAA